MRKGIFEDGLPVSIKDDAPVRVNDFPVYGIIECLYLVLGREDLQYK